MRYIGNKEKIIDKIFEVMKSKGIEGSSFFDFFSGTTNVARYFKRLNYQVYSSDLLYFSFVLQKAYISNNEQPTFKKLLIEIDFKPSTLFSTPLQTVVEYLNQIEPVQGFIYNNYTPKATEHLDIPRMYFSDENGKIIDAIRQKIEAWKDNELVNENEYFILLACLIETVPFYANISGVYAAFQKKWDPRAVKKMVLRNIELINNNIENLTYNCNSVELLNEVTADIFYLDPPYNKRQYAPNYHLLETISKYDNPKIRGVSGMRPYENQKSKFCNPKTGLIELQKIAKNGQFKHLIMSYNSEGIMSQELIIDVLGRFGKIELVEFDYRRYKSNSNGKQKKYIKEQLYILTKNEK